ncbi:cofactor-independent phosphoglycerate mutase [bacterium]|nr:cofactor-independent phosphoglycerate mutase [candidate division CSSED10-310 bacterium]
MKYVVFLGDGMADYPVARLNGRTPLMVADKSAIDRIAREGRTGRFVSIEADLPTGSAVANLSVLGYDPHETFQGRGVLEAASMGVELAADDMAMRINLITIEEGELRSHSSGHITTEESTRLLAACQELLAANGARTHVGLSYRHLLVLPGGDPRVECAPPHDHIGERAEDLMVTPKTEAAAPTALRLNRIIRKSWEILAGHPVNQARREAGKLPANSLWPWSPGVRPKMHTMMERFGIKGAVISAVDLIKGLGVYAGMDVITVEGATGLYDTNYEGKADACLAALNDHDFVFVHVEATDEAGHERNLELKIKCIEMFDRRLIQRVMDGIERRGTEVTYAVLPDHPTPVDLGIHVRDPVPVAIWNPTWPPDAVQVYDEDSVAGGALGLLRGAEFIESVFERRQ